MADKLTFEELYESYLFGTFGFVNDDLCKNLIVLLDSLNNRTYLPKFSNCYVVTEPALREIYAAQFSDRIVQHFYMKEIEDILETKLVDGCSSCRKGKGTDYALGLLKKYLTETSNYGKTDCYFLKIDLSGYFMSIDRKIVSKKFTNLINSQYTGKHKALLLYLTPVIFENNPALNCRYKCNEEIRNKVPERRKMNPKSEFGMAIGNLTAQAGSNLNLTDFDNFVVNELKLNKYVRYVDDIVIVSENKQELIDALPFINKKLDETHQKINVKKTKIDTAYHGVNFLGKVSYPYGYQKSNKQVIIRTYNKARNIKFTDIDNLLSKTNAQIGTMKNYNCRKLVLNYEKHLPSSANALVNFNINKYKFIK